MIHKEYNPKHSPVIEVEKEGELYKISVEVGKEVEHPNAFDHYIGFVEIYFQPEGKEPILISRVEFNAHGEENNYTKPKVIVYAKLEGKGKIIAISYCNKHGLWISEKEIQ